MPKVKVYKIVKTITDDGLFEIDNPDVLGHELLKVVDNVDVNFRTKSGIEHSKLCASVQDMQWNTTFFIPLELIAESHEIVIPDATPEQPSRRR